MSGQDGGYLLPEVIDPPRVSLCIQIPDDPNHIIAFWGALEQLSKWWNWQRDDAHTAKEVAAVWLDVWKKARESFYAGDCATDECRGYAPNSPRISWFPENPFQPGDSVPSGYLFHPFTVVTNSLLSQIISQFGLGYEAGDVYTDLTKTPPGDWREIINGTYLGLPGFRINNLVGEGVVKLHLLNIPQGGRALIIPDGQFHLTGMQWVELNKDLISIPQETQTPIVIEVEIKGSGEHFLDVVFTPTVDDTPIPVYFGGGLRAVEICGFGETIMNDPCCPDDARGLSQLIRGNNHFMQYFMGLLDDGTPQSFAPDAPPNFDSNPEQPSEDAYRAAALCNLVKQYVDGCMADAARDTWLAGGLTTAAAAVITSLGGFFVGTGMLAIGIAGLTLAQIEALEDENSKKKVVCCMFEGLRDQEITFEVFKHSLDLCGFTFPDNAAQLAGIVNRYNAREDNYRSFVQILESFAQDAIANGVDTIADCLCDCTDDLELVAYGPYAGVTQIIPQGNCVYRIIQNTTEATDHAGWYRTGFKDLLNRPLKVDYPPVGFTLQGQGGCDVVGACGQPDYHGDNFGGGFVPATALAAVVWWSGEPVDTYMKITLVPPEECP